MNKDRIIEEIETILINDTTDDINELVEEHFYDYGHRVEWDKIRYDKLLSHPKSELLEAILICVIADEKREFMREKFNHSSKEDLVNTLMILFETNAGGKSKLFRELECNSRSNQQEDREIFINDLEDMKIKDLNRILRKLRRLTSLSTEKI